MSRPKTILKDTETYIKNNLRYVPETGELVRAQSHRGAPAGAVGCLDSKGYSVFRCNRQLLKVHRVIWFLHYGEWPSEFIDHINGIKSDNRISNLRNVTNQENHKNQAKAKNNTSGCTGVYWCKRDKKWRVRIKLQGRYIELGHYKCFELACFVRKEAENQYGYHENHGRIANV